MPRRTLIIGCGYVGLSLGLELQARGDNVTGWVRSPESARAVEKAGIARVATGSVADTACWKNLELSFDLVVHSASTGGGGVEAYREVFLEGVRQINRYQPQARRVFVSSTSVYGQTDGSWVEEASPTIPAAATSRVLVEAEREATSAGAMVIRAAGIYGPGRARLFEKFRHGEAVMEGDGSRWINQVHRDDLVAAIIHLLERGTPGEIFNAADDEPVMLRDFYAWCSQALDLPLPPHGDPNPNRKRGLTNKRVSNRKLRASGWALRFPSFREGLAERV